MKILNTELPENKIEDGQVKLKVLRDACATIKPYKGIRVSYQRNSKIFAFTPV